MLHSIVIRQARNVRVLRLFRSASSQLRTGGRLHIRMNGRLRRNPQSQKGTLSNRMGNGALLRLLLVSTFASPPCGEWKNLLRYRCNRPSLAPGTPQSPGQLSASVEQGTIPTGLVLVRLLRGEGRPLHNKTRRRFSSAGVLLDHGDQAA